jgi:D-alanyl-lipoteichoic acid acyltransferase DltB (MBOAT superfamily)
MSFISWQYGLFLASVVLLYWQMPGRTRIGLILAASYFFYGVWDVRFLALLLTSTTIDYYCGLAMVRERSALGRVFFTASLPFLWLGGYTIVTQQSGAVATWILGAAAAFPVFFTGLYHLLWQRPESSQRKAFLLLSILTNLGVLGFFKYFNFFADNLETLLGLCGFKAGWVLPNIILPVAISFYTFQSIAYAVDIYRNKAEPVRDFITFAAYLSFFPQLVSGPIERPNDLVPQFVKPSPFDWSNIHRGLKLLLVGLFKKLFVADNCALLAGYAFDPKVSINGWWALLGVLGFTFQIYGDFSGYTDIARGSARLIGFHLNMNFRFPYFSRGPSDFWQRWHITLSSWFRDYVYIPLGGNRGSTWLTLRNLWITMLLAGLWHGASWGFVFWGAYYAALLTLYRLCPPLSHLENPKDSSTGKTILAMSLMFFFTMIGWVLFRCPSLTGLGHWFGALGNWQFAAALPWIKPFCWLLLHIVPLLILQGLAWKGRDEVEIAHLPWPVRGIIYAVLIVAVASSASGDVEFIYFQF